MDRKTDMKEGEIVAVPVAASTVIEAGKLVARDASGYAVEASDVAGLVVLGRAEGRYDNSAGANGAINALVRRRMAFKWDNAETNAVTIAHVGSSVFVADDETVSIDGGTNDIVVGKCIGVDTDGVWVE